MTVICPVNFFDQYDSYDFDLGTVSTPKVIDAIRKNENITPFLDQSTTKETSNDSGLSHIDQTPFFVAVKCRNKQAIELLLQEYKTKNEDLSSVMTQTCSNYVIDGRSYPSAKKLSPLQLLLENKTFDPEDKDIFTCILAQCNEQDLCQKILENTIQQKHLEAFSLVISKLIDQKKDFQMMVKQHWIQNEAFLKPLFSGDPDIAVHFLNIILKNKPELDTDCQRLKQCISRFGTPLLIQHIVEQCPQWLTEGVNVFDLLKNSQAAEMLRVCKTCNIKLNLDEKNEKNQTPFDVAWEAVDGETVLLLKKWGLTSEKHNLEDPNQWVFMPDDSIQACKASGVDSLALNLQEVFSFQPVKELRQTHGNRIFESKYELVKTLTGNFRLSKVFNATSLEQEDNFFPNMNLDQLFEFYTKFFNIRPKEYTHIKIQVDEKKGLATGIDLHQDSSLGDKFCEKVIIVYALNEGAHQKLDFVDLENLEVRSIPVENGTAICFDNRRYLHGVKAPQDSQQEICQRNLITFRFYR